MTKVNWIFLQSFRDDQLRFFNRDHDAATGIKAIGTENANKYSIVSLEKWSIGGICGRANFRVGGPHS